MNRVRRLSFAASATLAASLCAGPAGAAPRVLLPGQTYANVAAEGLVVRSTSSPGLLGEVGFSRADSLTQSIRLFASANVLGTAWQTAAAQGALFVDFCVPRQGASVCDTVSDPAAPTIDVNLTFKYGLFGELRSEINSKARFSANVRLIDQETKLAIEQRVLGSLSVSGPQTRVIQDVPIPMPNLDNARVVQPVTFSTFVQRGRIYRFQLGAAVFAESRLTGKATGNFRNSLVLALAPNESGRVQLQDLTIRIAQEAPNLAEQIAELRAAVRSLGEHIVAMGGHMDEMALSFGEDIAASRERADDLADRTAATGSLLFREPGARHPMAPCWSDDSGSRPVAATRRWPRCWSMSM